MRKADLRFNSELIHDGELSLTCFAHEPYHSTLGVWDEDIHTTIYKIDNQPGSTV